MRRGVYSVGSLFISDRLDVRPSRRPAINTGPIDSFLKHQTDAQICFSSTMLSALVHSKQIEDLPRQTPTREILGEVFIFQSLGIAHK